MNKLSAYNLCPLCGAAGIEQFMLVKDHSVSQEDFKIFHCRNCQLRFTVPPPSPEVIARYYKSEDYISHSDTAKGFVNRIYRWVRTFAISQKRKLVEKAAGKKKGKLLDVGSGTGYFAGTMKNAGWSVTGLEPDEGARQIAISINQLDLLPVETLFQFPENSFDAITLWHVLEHVHDVKAYIAVFKKLLKKDGKLFIAVPNYTSHDAEVYREYWAAYDVPRHLYHFAPATMQWLMQESGFKIDTIKPMWFDSFYVSLLSSKYKNGSTSWFGAIWTGFYSNMKAMMDVKKCSSLIYVISTMEP